MLSPSLHVFVSFAISFTRLRTPSRLSIPISRASCRASERAVAAERCVLLKSGKNDDDDDDEALSGESDWSEKDSSDVEKEIGEDDANGNDGRTEVGKTMEKSAIGRLGNKPPTNA